MTFLLIVALIGACLAGFIVTRPDEFRVTRRMTMAAAPEKIFPHVNTLSKWQPWSPWAKLDPDAKNWAEGPDAGVGALQHWDGNKNVGAGSMTIVESIPNQKVTFKLAFLRPFVGQQDAEFTFTPDGNGTVVSWSMFGHNSFAGKCMGMFIDCEKMVGTQFDKGLTSLKEIVEA